MEQIIVFLFLKCYFCIFTTVNAKARIENNSEDHDFIFGAARFPEELLVSEYIITLCRHWAYRCRIYFHFSIELYVTVYYVHDFMF